MRTEYPIITGPMAPATTPGASKADLLARARRIVSDLRRLAIATRALGHDVNDLERDLSRVEHDVAVAIDECMAARYRQHEIEVARLHGLETRR